MRAVAGRRSWRSGGPPPRTTWATASRCGPRSGRRRTAGRSAPAGRYWRRPNRSLSSGLPTELPAVPDAKASITYTVDAAGRMTVEANADLPDTAPSCPAWASRGGCGLKRRCRWRRSPGRACPARPTPRPVQGRRLRRLYRGAPYPRLSGAAGMRLPCVHPPGDAAPGGPYPGTAGLRCALCLLGAALHPPTSWRPLPTREELPDPVRTTVSVFGAMRGVGGIDSWGTDVEPPYHVTGKQLQCRFVLQLTAGPVAVRRKSMEKQLLITGLSPLAGRRSTPLGRRWPPCPTGSAPFVLTRVRVPVEFGRAGQVVLDTAGKLHPDVILCIGAGGRPQCGDGRRPPR